MVLRLHRPPLSTRRARVLAAAGLIIGGSLGAAVLDSPAAHADVGVHTIVANAEEATGPYTADASGYIVPSGTNITISCYVTGNYVSGPYGQEDVWDEVTGGVESNGSYVETGDFVPDADVYTGSNSAVVPRCATALGYVIGRNWISSYAGPGQSYAPGGSSFSPGQHLELKCYTTGQNVQGPYGWETTWDLITETRGGPEYVPDADIYTGSNSAVVPHC